MTDDNTPPLDHDPATPAGEPETPAGEPDAPAGEPETPAGDPATPAGEPDAPAAPAPVLAPEPALPGPAADRRAPVALGILGAGILGIAIGALGLGLATGTIGRPPPSPSPSPAASEAPAGNTIGSSSAPVTLEVWADYQCPFCRLEDLLFGGAVEREYVSRGIVRIVYRDFAFLGQESIDAAVAARCAGAQEPAAQLRFHDALYTFQQGENQGRYARENLVQMAQIAGVTDTAAFTACLDDPSVARAVADETQAGRDVGVDSTPTMRLRGPGGERMLTGFSQTWPPLREAIEAVRTVPTASPSPSGSESPAAPSSTSPGSSAAPSAPATPGAPAGATPAPSPAPTPAPTPAP